VSRAQRESRGKPNDVEFQYAREITRTMRLANDYCYCYSWSLGMQPKRAIDRETARDGHTKKHGDNMLKPTGTEGYGPSSRYAISLWFS
jgi:hypothetical protein